MESLIPLMITFLKSPMGISQISHLLSVSKIVVISMRVLKGKFPVCGLNLRVYWVLSFPRGHGSLPDHSSLLPSKIKSLK
jgi:hypothetical protein